MVERKESPGTQSHSMSEFKLLTRLSEEVNTEDGGAEKSHSRRMSRP